MTKRRKIVAGNWKMNKNYQEGKTLANSVVEHLTADDVLVILGVPYIHLKSVSNIIKSISNVRLAAQNCHQEESGAYTGEISAAMLASVGADFVILGHSERRAYFGETDELLAKKVDIALANGMSVIFCCGEELSIREAGTQNDFVAKQLQDGLFHLDAEQMKKVVIAYEPVWAIGTGKTASSAQAQEMHQHIRQLLNNQYGEEIANVTYILYGGSCKPTNAKELFSQPDVDGGLIGGASLKAADFNAIIDSCYPAQ